MGSAFLMAGANGAWADSTAANENQLEEVVVTAQFRQEKLQTTPIAITAITAAGLEQRNFTMSRTSATSCRIP